MTEHTVRIENPGRVQRILFRICEANLDVIIRAHHEPSIAVRGKASAIINIEKRPGIRISGLSSLGSQHLKSSASVRVEFRGMSTQVAFDSRILIHEENAFVVTQPTSIISTERRKNARFRTSVEHSAFIDLGALKAAAEVPKLQAPIFSNNVNVDHWCRIQDISEGGLCAVSRFPAILTCVSQGYIEENALLALPMTPHLSIRLETRWIKKIKDGSDGNEVRFARRALIGFEFKNPSEEVILRIRQFVRTMNLSQAI